MQKVLVGLSGGVDSSVATALLKQQEYDVSTAFMKNWSGDDFGIQADCPWEEDQKAAETAALALNVPFRSYNFEKEYRKHVVEYFFSEYAKGRTPNPDVMCNREIKFSVFLDRALADGADLIATGHYAQVRFDTELNEYILSKGVDQNKDQSYFLAALNQEQLSKSLFPIGGFTKPQIRQMAADFGLPNFARPDSQGICFIGEIDVQEFLRQHISTKVGEIRDVDTDRVVGNHDGVYFYTIGQREGLGIGGQALPYFVVGKDVEKNILYVGHGNNHPKLSTAEVKLESLHIVSPKYFEKHLSSSTEFAAVPRYRHKGALGNLDLEKMVFTFNEPQRAITSGQTIALYVENDLVASGVIG